MTEHASAYAINSYSYIYTQSARDCIDLLANEGHHTFELMLFPGHLWPSELDVGQRLALRKHIDSRGLRIMTLNIPAIDVNLAAAAREMRAYSLGILADGVRLAGELGAKILFGPGKPNPLFPMEVPRMMEHFYAALDRLLPLAKDCGTKILIENIPLCFLPDADSLMAALDDYGDASVGVVYDVANAVYYRENPTAGLRRVRDRLELVHLSDTGLDAYRHSAVGTGVVPFASLPPVLKEVGYSETPLLEIITRDPAHDIPDSIAKLSAMGWPTAPHR
jgi:sugar phosphate isomerase/epimerase